MDETVGRRLVVEGRVQGVGYRIWAARTMGELGLSGWVQNLADRRVEVVVEGPVVAVESFERRCHVGPRSARVLRVSAAMRDVSGLDGVEIR